jgi:hypothetical protein
VRKSTVDGCTVPSPSRKQPLLSFSLTNLMLKSAQYKVAHSIAQAEKMLVAVLAVGL